MTKLVLDLSDPDIAAACSGHKAGDPITFSSVTGTVASVSDKQVTVDVDDVEYAGDDESQDTSPDDAPETPSPVKSKKPAVAAASKSSMPY